MLNSVIKFFREIMGLGEDTNEMGCIVLAYVILIIVAVVGWMLLP